MAAVRVPHLLLFTREFASMISSRLRLVDVLDNLAAETPQQTLRSVIEDVSDQVQSGVDLGDAMGAHPNVFGDVYVNTVRAGLLSGQLGGSLSQVAEYLDKMATMQRKLRRATAYPIFVVVAFIVVFHIMTFGILPRFEQMFSSFGKKLPGPTQILLDIGHVYADSWPLIAGVLFVSVFGFIVWTRTEEGRLIWDEKKLGIPVLGRFWRLAAISRFARTFAVQVRNSVPLLQALNVSALAIGNKYLEACLYEVARDIELGSRIAAGFARQHAFDGIVQQMIAAGEEAGALDEMLLSAAEYYDGLLADQADFATNMINPLLTAVTGAGTAAMLIAAFLPVFDISGSAM